MGHVCILWTQQLCKEGIKKNNANCKKPQRRVSGSCLFGARVNKLNIMHNSRPFSFNCWKWYMRHIRNALLSFTEQVQRHKTNPIQDVFVPLFWHFFLGVCFFKKFSLSLCAADGKRTNTNFVLYTFSISPGRRELTHSLVEFPSIH